MHVSFGHAIRVEYQSTCLLHCAEWLVSIQGFYQEKESRCIVIYSISE